MFTLLGFMGIYTVAGMLFLFLMRREIEHGPLGELSAPSNLSAGAESR
jgi:cytochrome d ubiquinol oxidase subunit I